MEMNNDKKYCPIVDVDGVMASGKQFDLDITIGSVSLYPLVQIPIYLVFTGLGYISYLILKKTIKFKA